MLYRTLGLVLGALVSLFGGWVLGGYLTTLKIGRRIAVDVRFLLLAVAVYLGTMIFPAIHEAAVPYLITFGWIVLAHGVITLLLELWIHVRYRGVPDEARVRFAGEKAVPSRILIGLFKWIAVLVLTFVVLRRVLHVDLGPVVFTSAALTFVLGFALQDLLGNLFSGIALNMERPFNKGHWVQVAGREGKVIDMSWRATRIRTLNGDYVVIPNSDVSKNQIENYSEPSPRHAENLTVPAPYGAPPNLVRKVILETLEHIDFVLDAPRPLVFLNEFGDSSINYIVKFWISDFGNYPVIDDEVMTRLWYALSRAGIIIPFPIRDVRITHECKAEEQKPLLIHRSLLESIALFTPLSREEMDELVARVGRIRYGRGEPVVKQSDPGDCMYVIVNGDAEVLVEDETGTPHPVATLTKGDFLGEASLLTGEPRNATVKGKTDLELAVLSKAVLSPIVERRPELAEKFAEIVEERRVERERVLEESKGDRAARAEKTATLASRIRSWLLA
jgi:small-conductance mechanosensitive channel/CRP-like cAMP-binding protein